MPSDTTEIPATPRTRGWAAAGLGLLFLLDLFYVFGALSDLRSDAGSGLPVDHNGTFASVAGTSFTHLRAVAPGVAHYITVLESGYAWHELTFALLFLAVLVFPFRRRQRWAWWAAWIPMIANLGYTFTFGAHDSAILARSLIATIARPVLLLAHIPAFFHRAIPVRH